MKGSNQKARRSELKKAVRKVPPGKPLRLKLKNAASFASAGWYENAAQSIGVSSSPGWTPRREH